MDLQVQVGEGIAVLARRDPGRDPVGRVNEAHQAGQVAAVCFIRQGVHSAEPDDARAGPVSLGHPHLQGPDVSAWPDGGAVERFTFIRRRNGVVLDGGNRGRIAGDHPPRGGADGHPAVGNQFCLQKLDGPARAECCGFDMEPATRDQAQDLVAQPRHAHVGAWLVALQAVRHQAGGRRHMLFVLVPRPLGMDGGAESAAAQRLVVEIAFGKFWQFLGQRWPFRRFWVNAH